MIKTETLTANVEKLVEVKDAYAMIENRGTGTVYASKKPNISAGGDGVLAIDAGNAKVLRNVDGKIYVKSNETGIVEIQTANDLHFFKSRTSKGGGGGEPVDAYTKSQTDALLAAKVGKNDFATKTVGGVVKIDSIYGVEIDNNGTLKTAPAYDNFLQNFADDNHVITPYRFKKAMGLFGINSQTQIDDMQTEIDSKVDNDSFSAENLIKFPYANVPSSASGADITVESDGTIIADGTTTKETSGINIYTHFRLDDGIYTLSPNSESGALGLRFYGYDADGNSVTLFSVYGNDSRTFTVGNDGYDYAEFSINGRINTAVSFNNTAMKPMLEKGSVSHIYQPYKLSRQSLRDDIDALITLL